MQKEVRIVCYDEQLKLEAYRFQGYQRSFPNHFHEYYVLGFVEDSQRLLTYQNREYLVEEGDLLLFNPRDNHSCRQVGDRPLDYRALNVGPDTMKRLAEEITGKSGLPVFAQPVVRNRELAALLKELHQIVMAGEQDFRKEELLLLLLQQIFHEYAALALDGAPPDPDAEIERICRYLEEHYAEPVTLDGLSAMANRSKYYFLRLFTKEKGISPYRYLENIRISQAKKLLEQGVLPQEAAARTGFSDQSHFTNYFREFIGLTPKQYYNIFRASESKREG